ncbi:MAG: ATP-grasp domain-containing protein [Gammaproteobacteria bacterium]|nr:MAG: ATP-grasp domain-containing protein [Gammaproteobacteria bacterium]UTW42760.1 ATP-grasp domain-containing protein [bacterium SCSIO 12844]
MALSFIIITHVKTVAINDGFLPEIIQSGFNVTIITDCYDEHLQLIEKYPNAIDLIKADVFNPMDIITKIHQHHLKPIAIFSNSDHLQTSTAIVAEFYQLPGKSFQSTLIVKNKSMMRQTLKDKQLSQLWYQQVSNETELKKVISQIPFPCIAKPTFGVASIDVEKIQDIDQLNTYCKNIWQTNAKTCILLEAFIEGDIYSIETIGDGKNIHLLGGFKTNITQPPYFIELGANWISHFDQAIIKQLINILSQLNIKFGACHTEFSIVNNQVEIIEINYRSVGDYKEFLLNELYSNYFKALIALYLGKALPILKLQYNYACIEYFPAINEGILTQLPKADSYQHHYINYSVDHFKQLNTQVHLTHSNKDYLSAIRVYGHSDDLLFEKLNHLKKNLIWEIN